MKQQTLTGFQKFGNATRRVRILAGMERVMPWAALAAAIEPVHSKGGSAGPAIRFSTGKLSTSGIGLIRQVMVDLMNAA